MSSVFGVRGVIAKRRKTVPDWATPVLPGSTVKAYDGSTRHKRQAAVGNLAAKVGAGTAGGALGLGATVLAGKKLKPLREGVQIGEHHLAGATLKGWTASTLSGGLGGTAGGVAGGAQLHHVKNDKHYRYQP